MAQSYSLAVYSITINTRWKKDEKQVLSDFNNGQDFLQYIDTMMSSWKQNLNRGDQYDPVNKDGNEKEGNVFRLSRDNNGDYYLYRRGRYLSGILECGEYGTEEEGVDIDSGEVVFRKTSKNALLKPFYFMFYIPEISNIGFLILEKIGNNGIMTVLNNAIIKYYSTTPSDNDYVLKINPLSIDALVKKKMEVLRYEAKKIELRKVQKEDLRIDKVSGNTIEAPDISTSIVYTPYRNKFINVLEFVRSIRSKRNDANTLYEVENDFSCEDITVTVKVGDKDKVLSLQNIQTLGMTVDITHDIELGANHYPTFQSIDMQSNQVVSYIKEQFPMQ